MENQTSPQVLVFMPAIYRLDGIEGFQEEYKAWGWHRATELLTAVQNILLEQGKGMKSAAEISDMFLQADPFLVTEAEEKGLMVVKGGCLLRMYCGTDGGRQGSKWLRSAVEADEFLPAKVGMMLINAAKHPFRTKLFVFIPKSRQDH